LTNPLLKGQALPAQQASVYNQSLVADVLVQEGEADTRAMGGREWDQT